MTDWWQIANSNLVGLVIATFLGVLLASLVTWFQSKRNEEKSKKATASILGNEIASIHLLASQAMQVDAIGLKSFKEYAAQDKILEMSWGDVDFPRSIYDRPSIDLALFEPDLASTIAELYRWIEFTRVVKNRGNEFAEKIKTTTTMIESSSINQVGYNAQVMRRGYAVKNFAENGDGYIQDLARVAELSKAALDGLKKITSIDDSKVLGDYFKGLEPPAGKGASPP